LIQARGAATADLKQLAARRRAGSRQAPGPKADGLCEIVDRCERDQLPLHPQLSEEDEPANRPGAERSQRPVRSGVVPLEVRLVEHAEPVDLERPRRRWDGRKRPAERLLARYEAPAENRDEHGDGKRHAGDDENGSERP
jgi:hypothetical protein